MKCNVCGQEVEPGKFCSACGTPAPAVQEAAPAEQTPYQQAAPTGQAPYQQAAPMGQTPYQQAAPMGQTPYQQAAPMGQTPYQQSAPVDPAAKKGNTAMILGIVALVMGVICSCLFACLGGLVPLVLAILGIVFGAGAMKESKAAGFENKKAKIGMILSIVAIAVIVVFIIINGIAGGIIASSTNYYNYY